MKEHVIPEIVAQMMADARFHSKLLEMYFLSRDEEVGDLTWKIASLPPQKRSLVAQLIAALCEHDAHPKRAG